MTHKPRFYWTNQTVNRHFARDVELYIEKETGLQLENPFYDGDAKEVDELDSQGTTSLSADEICGMDLRKIRDSDGIVAYMTHLKCIGSVMEIAIAAQTWGKPCYIIAPNPYHKTHPWIIHFASELFDNEDEFIAFAIEKWGL